MVNFYIVVLQTIDLLPLLPPPENTHNWVFEKISEMRILK